MTYKTAKLNLTSQGITGSRRWIYQDTGTLIASAVASGWITDAKKKGMVVGDVLEFRDDTTGISVTGRVTVVQDTGGTQGTWVQDTH